MNLEQKQVQEFMVLAGQAGPAKPGAIDEKTAALRVKLITEENQELAKALGFEYLDTHVQFYQEKQNLVEVADAIGDLLYVVYGVAVAAGIDIDPFFQEIHRSNMTKFIDGHRRSDGKWVKGASYTPANLGPILEAQMN